MDILTLQQQLMRLQDIKYQEFQRSLVPGKENIIGVRIPLLRAAAKKLLQGDHLNYLETALPLKDSYYEETIMQALIIAQGKMPLKTRLNYIVRFLPKIDNWAVCDIFCSALKEAKKYPADYWQLLQTCLHSDSPFTLRFAAVMLLSYYCKNTYAPQALQLLCAVKSDSYYVKMAVAWAVSVFYIHQPHLTLPLLQEQRLDKDTHNKAIRKICESLRTAPADKAALKKLKQK